METIILPLAISFFTFQQITYLVDSYRGEAKEYKFLHYSLFVTFFPQLIAGPIVHHSEMMPQFFSRVKTGVNYRNLAIGLSIFTIGLSKKVLIADKLSSYASEGFDAVAQGVSLSVIEAWRAAMAYTFQLYFDFSGYSDMAIGIAFCFGIILPINFNSPYKAKNIIDFWRRWHMTLSRFLRDYVYIPLGGNRKGRWRRYQYMLLTMLVGGVWHGAAWTFIFWGLLHGMYLIINHAWHRIKEVFGWSKSKYPSINMFVSRLFTFFVIVIAWVFFRSESMTSAFSMLKGMFGGYGFVLPPSMSDKMGPLADVFTGVGGVFLPLDYANGPQDFIPIILLLFLVWKLPNTQEIVLGSKSSGDGAIWKPNMKWLMSLSVLFLVVLLNLSSVSEFLYFQF